MKLRNIAVAFAATLLTFASCVEESVITPEGKTEAGLPTTLNLSIATDGLITKAAPGGYEYANADELLINRLAIAIFRDNGDGTVGERLGFGYATFTDGVANAECPDNADRPAYSISNIPAKTGDVKILVIANSTYTETQLKNVSTYAGFKGLMETNTNAEGNFVFDQKELVKSGEFSKTLTIGQPRLHLELRQLAARIELKFEVNVPSEDPRYEADSAFTKQELVDAVNNKIIANGSNGNPGLTYSENGVLLYETVSGGGSIKHLKVYNNHITRRTITPTWAYDITSLTIENINTKSDPILGDYTKGNSSSYTYNAQELLADPYELTFDPKDRIASVVFYSYEKKYQTPSPLKITVGGNLVYRENITAITYAVSSTYEWENSGKEGNNQNGWGPAPGHFLTETHTIIGELPDPVPLDPVDITTPERRLYEAIIDPKETDTGNEATNSNTYGIVHGNTYEVKGLIDTKNKAVNFTINVIPWSARPVVIGAEILDIHYLFVKETNVIMANVADYFVDYKSDSPISFSNKKATYVEYYRDNNKIVKSRTANVAATQYSFTVVNGQIKIHSNIPANYFPRTLSFDVTNAHGLTEHVEVTQYPPQYLTAQTSANSGPADSPDGATNPNIFTVNIIAAEGLQVGAPRGSNGQTITTEAANNLISPKFMVASRYGVVNGGKYSSSSAITRCRNYWETLDASKTGAQATYPTGTWRVPTLAELEFMNVIQDSDGIVNYLFNNTGEYWSARQDTNPTRAWYYDFGDNKRAFVTTLTATRSGLYIRCVHDVY